LGNLVYSAPFLAPLSYVGVGLLLMLLRTESMGSPAFGWWVVLLAQGGFLGNFGMSLLDHAQNGLFRWTEWVPVISAATATGFLVVVLVRREATFIRITCGILGLQVVVGITGFALHVGADLGHRALGHPEVDDAQAHADAQADPHQVGAEHHADHQADDPDPDGAVDGPAGDLLDVGQGDVVEHGRT